MKAKKSLGQHFLTSTKAVNKMVTSSGVKKGDTVLEIGPGKGVLTSALLESGAKVVAVEKDDLLIPLLTEKYKKEIGSGKLTLIHGDILDLNLSEILQKKYSLVANIPYYITGQIIRMFLEAENQPESITVLVQKEVGERIVGKPVRRGGGDKKESILSISVKAYGTPKYEMTVPRGSFNPAPNVDSAIINIANISKNNFSKISEKKFFEIIHAGFAHKRKQLLPNLSELFSRETIQKAFEINNIPLTARGEDIDIETWLKLSESLLQK